MVKPGENSSSPCASSCIRLKRPAPTGKYNPTSNRRNREVSNPSSPTVTARLKRDQNYLFVSNGTLHTSSPTHACPHAYFPHRRMISFRTWFFYWVAGGKKKKRKKARSPTPSLSVPTLPCVLSFSCLSDGSLMLCLVSFFLKCESLLSLDWGPFISTFISPLAVPLFWPPF